MNSRGPLQTQRSYVLSRFLKLSNRSEAVWRLGTILEGSNYKWAQWGQFTREIDRVQMSWKRGSRRMRVVMARGCDWWDTVLTRVREMKPPSAHFARSLARSSDKIVCEMRRRRGVIARTNWTETESGTKRVRCELFWHLEMIDESKWRATVFVFFSHLQK